ncbi:MAG: hypothetical protein AAGC55_02460, partial [Myxococcota bacterium]
MYRLLSIAALLLAALALNGPAHGGATATWEVDSYKEFDEGEAESAFITSMGEVKPGWKTERTELEVDGVWAALRAADGSLLLGTGDGGSVYRVGGTKASKLAAVEDAIAVVSLAQAGDGTIYAGTMPGGEIWTIDGKTGTTKKLAQLKGAETVWSLAMDPSGTTVYAGTGPSGELFAVDVKSGASRVVFASEDKRILALAVAKDGAVWLGTSDKALVFRYDPKRKTTRAMADFSGNEITALAPAPDGMIVAANDFEEPITSGIKTSAAIDKAEKKPKSGETPTMPANGSKPGADKPTPSGTEPTRKRARKGKGALYRVAGDGALEQLHALTATYFTSIAVSEAGTIFAGAGDKGRIYLVDTDDSVSTAFDVDERIIATLSYDRQRGLSFTTSDAAALYQATGKANGATYLSKVHDTKVPSRFGRMVWHSSGSVRIETRTGNTSEPGPGWSNFAAPRSAIQLGGGQRAGRIASPVGRYIQYRVTFTGGDDSVLRRSRVYFLPKNRATKVEQITIGNSGGGSGATLKSKTASPRSPVLKLSWKVANPDSDKTRYELEVRREGDALWRPIAIDDDALTSTSFSWNTETFPDGYYRLRVTARDDLANPAARTRESFKTSALFLVDNQRPRIEGISVQYPRASARAVDRMSAIAEMSYSVDDGPWQVGTSNDG